MPAVGQAVRAMTRLGLNPAGREERAAAELVVLRLAQERLGPMVSAAAAAAAGLTERHSGLAESADLA